MPMMKETMLKRLLLPMVAAGGGGSAPIQDTATGNPLVFLTDLAKPLKSMLIPFTPKQTGSGDPSPSNVRPIVPWNGMTVFGGGKNLIDDSKKYSPGATMCYIGALDNHAHLFLKAGTYTMTADFNGEVYGMYFKEQNDQSDTTIWKASATSTEKTFDIPKDGTYMFFAYRGSSSGGVDSNNIKSVMLVAGSTAGAYEPYKPITETDISFPSPVYGGTLDVVSGVLTVEWAGVTLTGAQDEVWSFTITSSNRYRALFYKAGFENAPKNNSRLLANYLVNSTAGADGNGWIGSTGNFLCYVFEGITTESDWRAYLAEHPLVIAYELEEPFEIQLTPAQITALVGNNTLWSDADGEMTATYLKKA